jgi:hypothetical protein
VLAGVEGAAFDGAGDCGAGVVCVAVPLLVLKCAAIISACPAAKRRKLSSFVKKAASLGFVWKPNSASMVQSNPPFADERKTPNQSLFGLLSEGRVLTPRELCPMTAQMLASNLSAKGLNAAPLTLIKISEPVTVVCVGEPGALLCNE